MLYEAGCIDSEGEAVEELWPLEKQLPFDEFKPSFWVESDLVRYLQMSIEEINLFYGPRGFTEEARVQRAEIDEKLLQLQERGQNMSEIARLLGFGIEKSRKCRAMRNALKRARAARGGENETKQPQGKGDKGLSQS